jgi:hypothetical protein
MKITSANGQIVCTWVHRSMHDDRATRRAIIRTGAAAVAVHIKADHRLFPVQNNSQAPLCGAQSSRNVVNSR